MRHLRMVAFAMLALLVTAALAGLEVMEPGTEPDGKVIIVSPGAQAVPSPWSNVPAWLPPARDFQTEGGPGCRVLGEPAQEYAAAGWQPGAGVVQDGWAEEGGIKW